MTNIRSSALQGLAEEEVSILVNKKYSTSSTKIDLKLEDIDINLEATATRLRPPRLPRGYPDILIVGVYLAEFEKNRQVKCIYQLKNAIEDAVISSNHNSRPLIFIAGLQ